MIDPTTIDRPADPDDPHPNDGGPGGVECRPVLLTIDVPAREVHRYLGYRRSGKAQPRVIERLDALWPLARSLVRPQGVFRVITKDEAARAGMPNPTEWVGVGLVTIGPALEEEIGLRTTRGELLDGLILDAFGSAAAEAAANALNDRLTERMREVGYQTTRRVSPGYGTWNVACQAEFLSLLPARELGVRLTPGSMMVPRKSVSFAVRCRKSPNVPEVDEGRCETCEDPTCRYRHEDQKDNG